MANVRIKGAVVTMPPQHELIRTPQTLEERLQVSFEIYVPVGSGQLDNTSFYVTIPHQGKSLDELTEIAIRDILAHLQKIVQALENRDYDTRWIQNNP